MTSTIDDALDARDRRRFFEGFNQRSAELDQITTILAQRLAT